MKAREANSFWVSYSDLATGLMIVFMVVMLLMVLQSLLKEAERAERQQTMTAEVERIVADISIILGTRRDLAAAIDKSGISDDVDVDPVTAQLSIPHGLLHFGTDEFVLNAAGERFLNRFAPAYFCALWMQECNGCERVDPGRPRGVRRILVTGHGDLQGETLHTSRVAQERAQSVVSHVHGLLKDCGDGDCGRAHPDAAVPPACTGHMDDVAAYAIERLWAASAGNTAHCIDAVFGHPLPEPCVPAPTSGPATCDDYDCQSPKHRSVAFVLELTGDDMTGMLLDVRALQTSVGTRPDESLDELAQTVAEACWRDPTGAYHGCSRFIEECVTLPPREVAIPSDIETSDRICAGFPQARRDSPALAAETAEVCGALLDRGEHAPGCSP